MYINKSIAGHSLIPQNGNSQTSSNANAINYFNQQFPQLSVFQQYSKIAEIGEQALDQAIESDSKQDIAHIAACLVSNCFYMGNYNEAQKYAELCKNASISLTDQRLHARSLYLMSAVFRGLANTAGSDSDQQILFAKAVKQGEDALNHYNTQALNDQPLLAKIEFNLGAAFADNPRGEPEKALPFYTSAIKHAQESEQDQDLQRTSLRLANLQTLLGQYNDALKTVNDIRQSIIDKRVAMHADYAEAKLHFVGLKNYVLATQIAKTGLTRAQKLGAKVDENRFNALLSDLAKHEPTLPEHVLQV